MKKMIPNIITASRIVVSVIAPFVFLFGNVGVAVGLYIWGALSDAIDGKLARKFNATSNLGKILDVISDKLYALGIMIPIFTTNPLAVTSLAALELTISIIQAYSKYHEHNPVYSERIGKFKTCILFPTLIMGLLSSHLKFFEIPFIIGTLTTLVFQVKTSRAYVNQCRILNNKKKDNNLEEHFKEMDEFVEPIRQKKPIKEIANDYVSELTYYTTIDPYLAKDHTKTEILTIPKRKVLEKRYKRPFDKK